MLSIKFKRMSHKNQKQSSETTVNFVQAKNLKCSLTDAFSTFLDILKSSLYLPISIKYVSQDLYI